MAIDSTKSYIDDRTRREIMRLSCEVIQNYLSRTSKLESVKRTQVMVAKDLVGRQIPNLTEEQGIVASNTIIQFIKDSSQLNIIDAKQSKQISDEGRKLVAEKELP